MKQNIWQKVCAVLCGAAMACSLAACAQTAGTSTETTSAETTSSEATSGEPTPAPEITPTPAPESGGEPTPAPEDASASSDEHTSVLPAPETGSEAFRTAFEENPIDAQYASDLELASSVALIIAASNTAAESWQAQIDSVYKQILERGDEETVEAVKEKQSQWINKQSDALQEIRNSVSEEDSMAAVTVAENIMLYYRSHAIDLCAILYDIDGQLVFG